MIAKIIFKHNTNAPAKIIVQPNIMEFIKYILVLIVLFLAIKMYKDSDIFQLKCVVSTVDGEKYCVRDTHKIQESADLLANTTQKCKDLVDYLDEKYPGDEDVKRLKDGFRPNKIMETLPNSEYTAYSENKGEKIAFCLNTEKDNGHLIDQNTLLFVAIHELSHIMTVSVGHNDEFWKNFKFLLENAKEAKIYEPVNYKKTPQRYCGMTITDSPYFDYE